MSEPTTEASDTAPDTTDGDTGDINTELSFDDEQGNSDTDSANTEEPADTDNPAEGEGDDDGEAVAGNLDYKAEDFELPEGMALDEDMMGKFMGVAKEIKLPKDQAQKLVQMYAEKQQEAVDVAHDAWEDVRLGWQNEIKADKEIGGKGYEQNKAVMLRALSKYGSKELVEFGNQYGWSDNPAYQRFLFKIGKSLSEDAVGEGNNGSPPAIEDIASRWYGKDK